MKPGLSLLHQLDSGGRTSFLSTPPARKFRYNPDYSTMLPSPPAQLLSYFVLTLALLAAPLLHATTLGRIDVTCTVCSAKSEQTVIGSTNAFGAPDLDLRPPEMQRSKCSARQ